jgi:hypothetical protein
MVNGSVDRYLIYIFSDNGLFIEKKGLAHSNSLSLKQ